MPWYNKVTKGVVTLRSDEQWGYLVITAERLEADRFISNRTRLYYGIPMP